jgi:hypothetical protein
MRRDFVILGLIVVAIVLFFGREHIYKFTADKSVVVICDTLMLSDSNKLDDVIIASSMDGVRTWELQVIGKIGNNCTYIRPLYINFMLNGVIVPYDATLQQSVESIIVGRDTMLIKKIFYFEEGYMKKISNFFISSDEDPSVRFVGIELSKSN